MKIIVCGAGSVGQSIVSYLTKGNNDIVVIDHNQRRLDEIAKEYDVLPILGEASHPDVLERAGALDADMILALTDVDEVNMLTCQIAYTLFNIPRKIARVDSESFLDPIWSALYNDHHLPVDLIISPDIEIAETILQILKYPGCSGILPMLDGKGCILNLKLTPDCPLLNIPLMQLNRQDENLDIAVVNILRDGQSFIPDAYDNLLAGDEINVYTDISLVYSTISAFGLEKPGNERLLIFGGNSIAEHIGRQVEQDDSIVSCKIIEDDFDNARRLAKDLSGIIVIHGEMLSDVILDEADIAHTDAAIAVTENDKDNLLASLLAAKRGVSSTLSVVNTPSYNNLVFNIGDNTLVDRSSVTISRLLKEIRRTKMQEAYAVSRGQGEIWEIRLQPEDICVGKKIGELNLPKLCRIFIISRAEEIIYPDPTTRLKADDIILIYIDSSVIRQVENIFA